VDTVPHVKIAVEIAEDLLRQAKAVAAKERTSLRALLEEGLRWALSKRERRSRFKLRNASVPGRGVQRSVTEGDWSTLRDSVFMRLSRMVLHRDGAEDASLARRLLLTGRAKQAPPHVVEFFPALEERGKRWPCSGGQEFGSNQAPRSRVSW
jgi:hypothetical protein